MARIYNFSAGPSMLPEVALEEVSKKMLDYEGSGMSVVEMSHRGKIFDNIHNETVSLVKEILAVPDDYSILFLQGGATLQFGMLPLSLLNNRSSADYVLTGTWSKKAYKDAVTVGKVNVIWDGEDNKYTRIPSGEELNFSKEAVYCHICSNETIGGIQWQDFPDTGGVPLIADMSSDIMSRPVPWNRVAMVYAGTQKNLAPSGMALVIVKKDLVEKMRKDLPAYLRYDLHSEKNSLYNTPPSFVIWVTNLTLKWLKSVGGISGIEKLRDEKANLIYDLIENSNGYYKNPVDKASRSKMNIVWRLPSEELEKKFIEAAQGKGLSGLKGHRSVGGCRASVYNAMPVEGVKALAEFMKKFMQENG